MAEKTEFLQAIDDAIVDADSLEQFINGSDSETVLTRLSAEYPTLKKAIKELFENGGLPATPFKTKSLMTASALADGDYAMVTDDTVNNGLYVKEAGAWVKSAYDPTALANAYTDNRVKRVINNFGTKTLMETSELPEGSYAMVTEDTVVNNGLYAKTEGAWVKSTYAPELSALDKVKELIELKDAEQADDLFLFVDNNGSPVMRVSGDGSLYLIGIEGDVAENINKNAVIAESIEKLAASNNILEVKDVDGKDAMVINKDGELLLPKIGSVGQELDVLNREILTRKEDKYTNGAKYADYAIAANAPNIKNINQILTKDYVASLGILSHTVDRLRVPALLRISQYSYKVFFEARSAVSDFGAMSSMVATIDVDPVSFATTASDVTVIHESEVIDGTQYVYMQPVGIKLDNGDILCFYTRRFEKEDHKFYMRKSVDNGVTWSDFTDLTYLAEGLGLNFLIANSRGFVKRYGKHKGRLIVPVWTSGKTYRENEYRSGYIYSDDNGASWAVADFAPYPTGNECQIAEATNGDLIMSIRIQVGASPKIIVRQSDETGIYTQIPQEKELTEARVMGGLIQGLNEYDFTTEKFVITTARILDRKDLLIHTSYDNCKTWVTHTVPETVGEWVAYTCVESVNAATLLVLWESEWTTNLTCAVISIHDLIKGEE